MFCSSGNPQMTALKKHKLLHSVKNNNHKTTARLINDNPLLLEEKFDNEHEQRTILQIACDDVNAMDKVDEKTIEILIQHGADLKKPSKKEKWQPLHFAAINTNENKLVTIVKNLNEEQLQSLVFCSKHIKRKYHWCKNEDIDETYCNNALNLILKYGKISENYYNCCKILIEAGINVYQKDSNGVSPYDLIQTTKDQNLIQFLYTSTNKPSSESDTIFDLLKINAEDQFLDHVKSTEDFNRFDGQNEDSSSCTLLQLACFKNLRFSVERILSNDNTHPNWTISKNPTHPMIIALRQDNEDIVKLFLENKNLELPDDILIYLQSKYVSLKYDSYKYMDLVLDYLSKKDSQTVKKFITKTDEINRTALHYATSYGSSENVLKLLNLGASLTVKDIFGMTPLSHLEPSVLESFLDKCIKVPKNDDEINNMIHSLRNEKKNFTIEIDYQALINSNDEKNVLESRFLECMIRMKEFRYLLNHPVLVSYLTVKWQKFQVLIYFNLMLYFVAYVSLFFYGFGFNQYQTVSNTLLIMSLILLALREISQLIIFQMDYFRRLDSFLNLLLIGGIIYIIASGWFERLLNQNLLAAFSIVFLTSTLGIFLQMGNIPFFTVRVSIFRKISLSFFRYMLFYMFPVLAFFFCFYMLIVENQRTNDNFWQTLYSIVVMFAGDPNSDFPDSLETNPIFSHIIYILFVVVIGIILQNLLIGLAVSDLQEIQKEAELMDKKERVSYITSIEKIFFEQYRNSRLFKKMFESLLNAFRVFDDCDDAVLVIQPYNFGCVFVKNRESKRLYINDKTVLEPLQNVFKNMTLKRDQEDMFSLKKLYEKVETVEKLLEELKCKLDNK